MGATSSLGFFWGAKLRRLDNRWQLNIDADPVGQLPRLTDQRRVRPRYELRVNITGKSILAAQKKEGPAYFFHGIVWIFFHCGTEK